VPTILLVRHAQASFGAEDYDVLSDPGHAQAAVLADELARRGLRPDLLVSGSLARQRDTLAPLTAGAPLVVDARWDEYDTNDVLRHHSTTAARQDRPPGSAAPEISSREFQVILEKALLAWIADDSTPTTEPWPAFGARVEAALGAVAARLRSGETAVVCTSGGVIAGICVALLGLPATAFVAFNRVTVNTGVTKVIHGHGGSTLVSFNEHGHLDGDARSLITYR
jgi:broad specificity phosphatase PhoE